MDVKCIVLVSGFGLDSHFMVLPGNKSFILYMYLTAKWMKNYIDKKLHADLAHFSFFPPSSYK